MSVEYLGVPAWWRPYVDWFVQTIYPLGRGLDVSVTSWQRTRSHNAEVGGADQSQHLLATAWDVAGAGQNTFAARARDAGLVVVDEGTHVHVQLYPRGVIPAWVYDYVALA